VLRVEHVECVHPSANDVWLEQVSIGVNYLDVTQRNGAVPIPLPSGLGLEGAGRVAAVGAAVRDIVVGDRVAYVLGPIGSYAGARLSPAGRLIKLPDTVGFDDASALLFKGLTAQYLLRAHIPCARGVLLLYGAGGAVGQIIASWASHLGGAVIGIVSRETSIGRARVLVAAMCWSGVNATSPARLGASPTDRWRMWCTTV
jgi:NADPH:quinone reductase